MSEDHKESTNEAEEAVNMTNQGINEQSEPEDETFTPILRIMAENHEVIEDFSSGKDNSVVKAGALAEKLAPDVSKILENPNIKTLIETFTSSEKDKSNSLIGEALEVFTSKKEQIHRDSLTPGLNRLQTILINSANSSESNQIGDNGNNNAPVLSIAKSLLEMSRRKHF